MSALRCPIHAYWYRVAARHPWHCGLHVFRGVVRRLACSPQRQNWEQRLGLQLLVPKVCFHTWSDVSRSSLSRLIYNASSLAKSPHSKDVDAWAELLDYILPQRFKSSGSAVIDNDEEPSQYSELQRSITIVLAHAKATAKVDLLVHLGVHQERWQVVDWLVDVMLEERHNPHQEGVFSQQSLRPIWPTHERSLNEVTENPIRVESPERINFSLDHLYDWERDKCGCHNDTIDQCCLAHIWQALGCMILEAEDRAKGDANNQFILSYVLGILARMHHINALPATIYNYSPAKDRSVIQRPPTLYLLSARIMTILSDVAWKKHWILEMQKAKDYGYELPEPRIQPQLPHVGAEVWLDLILWACVEGGWISEAAWIISEMQKRNKDRDMKWSVIDWNQICRTKSPKLEWTAILKLQIDKSRLNQSTGIGIANSGTSSVDMGSCTISREVALAILDGIISRASTKSEVYGSPIETVQKHILDCRNLLDQGQTYAGVNLMNTMALRMAELTILDTQSFKPSMMDIVAMSPVMSHAHLPNHQAPLQIKEDGMDNSACILGLLHRNLYESSVRGDYHGILKSLETIQNLIDGHKKIYIQEFANELRERLLQGQEDSNSIEPHAKSSTPMLYPYIPVHVISQLLNTIAQNKFTDLRDWILHNNYVDGGILPSQMYGSTALHPALLDVATATADDVLLNRVLEELQPPLSGSTLHALLRCHIALDKWPAVQDILNHFKNSNSVEWQSSDALAVAAAVLRHEKAKHGRAGTAHRPQLILADILRGRFDHPRKPSEQIDLSKIQEANQLKRLLRSVPGGTFDFLPFDQTREAGRLSSKRHLPASSFSILLEKVVQQLGSRAGQSLWQKWCVTPGEHKGRQFNIYSTKKNDEAPLEEIVLPNVSMLRTIMRQTIRKLQQRQSLGIKNDLRDPGGCQNSIKSCESQPDVAKNSGLTEEDISLLQWAIPLYRDFGFNEAAIRVELPNVDTLV